MDITKIKNTCPKAWAKFVKWYAAWDCEQEGYIDELFTNMFSIEHMRALYSFFDEETKFVLCVKHSFDIIKNDQFWCGDIKFIYSTIAGDGVKSIYNGEPTRYCGTRVEAEIYMFTQAFKLLEDYLNDTE